MEGLELELRVELHILFNLKLIIKIGKPTFGIQQQQYVDSVMKFMPQHVDEHVVKQCLSAKTHLCENLVILKGKILPMFFDIEDGDQPHIPNVSAGNANKTRCEYALLMLNTCREFLNHPNGAALLHVNFKEELLIELSIVESYFKFNIERTSFTKVIHNLSENIIGLVPEYDTNKIYNTRTKNCSPINESNKKKFITDQALHSVKQYLGQVSGCLESYKLMLAKAAICLIPQIAASALENTKNSEDDYQVRRTQSSHI